MPFKNLNPNTLLFDIETGGLFGHRSSLLSIAYTHLQPGEKEAVVREFLARPQPGTWISKWSETQIWERIKKKLASIQSERTVLQNFATVLEKHAQTPGATIAGWNIGLQIQPQLAGEQALRGFDIPFLLTRARKHTGLSERYTSALQKMKIRDLGQEWAATVAGIASKPQYESVLDPDIYRSAIGYQKAMAGLGVSGVENKARAASTLGIKVAGWKQELSAHLLGIPKYEAHGAAEDIGALRNIVNRGRLPTSPSEELSFVQKLNKGALTNKLIASARYGTTFNLSEIQEKAKLAGLDVGYITNEIEKLAHASGATLEDVAHGRGMPEIWKKVTSSGLLQEEGESLLKRAGRGLTGEILTHKVGYGLLAGAAALYLTKPLSLFSGKDDNYNTIEGLPHGGMAERMRHLLTDFGSGYRGSDKSNELTEEQLVKNRFRFFTKSLEKYGLKEGTAHKRIIIPKAAISREALEGTLGYIPVTIAIPEQGQDELKSYRSPDNLYHLHSHGDIWTMHRDEHEAATMLMLHWKNNHTKDGSSGSFLRPIKAAIQGMPHVITEGIPGLYYYIQGLASDAQDMGERLRRDLPIAYKRQLSRFEPIEHRARRGILGFFSNLFSGKDDSYNTIEGMRHGGIAGEARRKNTDFGSGWLRTALSKGISKTTILTKWLGEEAGVGISGLTKSEFTKKALSSQTQDEFVKFLRSSRRVQGNSEKFLITKQLKAGGMGRAWKGYGLKSNKAAVYKENIETEVFADSGITGPHVQDEFGAPSAKYLGYVHDYMNQIYASTRATGGMISSHYEAMMTKRARQQFGDLVPEILGETKRGFLQEYAGTEMKSGVARNTAMPAIKRAWERVMHYEGIGVRHFDPQIRNVLRKGGRLSIIDWGVAAEGTGLSKESVTLSGQAMDEYLSGLRVQSVQNIPMRASLQNIPAHQWTAKTILPPRDVLQREATKATWISGKSGGRSHSTGKSF